MLGGFLRSVAVSTDPLSDPSDDSQNNRYVIDQFGGVAEGSIGDCPRNLLK